jgi:O-methyltransferase
VKNSFAGRALRAIAARRGSIVAPLSRGWQHERRIIAETRSKTQLLLTDPAALHILICVRAARRLSGAMAEAGVFKGGSARLICENKGDARLHLFDVFETLQNGDVAVGAEVQRHFGAVHGSRRDVERLLAPYSGVSFHPGLFPASTAGLEELRYSFVHVDLDLPGPTLSALDYFVPRLASGGLLIGDDYSDPDVRACFDLYFAGRGDTVIELPWSQVMIVRQGRTRADRN